LSLPDEDRVALVVGATGVTGRATCEELLARGWTVHALSRRAPVDVPGVRPVLVDTTDAEATDEALATLPVSHVFLTAWSRRDSEEQNIAVNGAIVRNVLASTGRAGPLRHVALVTGLKHYLGPFEAYGTGETRDTPFHEDEPRLSVPNFYYAQEDELWAAATRFGFTWSVHRSHTVIGYATGNAMNMGQTLCAQAALCREQGTPFVFPGNEVQWNGLTDMTDAGLLARHMVWAATTPAAANTPFNVTNGDVFRWRWMWPRLAALLEVEWEGYVDRPRPLGEQMASPDVGALWEKIGDAHGLRESRLDRVASWWHTDGDLNRPVECFTDMANSRRLGFVEQVPTLDSFGRLIGRLRDERVIP
jgi:nucleoside-diphosphate-sugar epimerase